MPLLHLLVLYSVLLEIFTSVNTLDLLQPLYGNILAHHCLHLYFIHAGLNQLVWGLSGSLMQRLLDLSEHPKKRCSLRFYSSHVQ